MSDRVLLDTNVLVYAHNSNSPFHTNAMNIVKDVIEGRLNGVLAQQNLMEFYSIITDRKRVTKPLLPKEAQELIKDYLHSTFEIIYPNMETGEILLSLCQENIVKNGEIFDVYLAATCISNNVETVLTANTKDFKKFKGVNVTDLNLLKVQ